jgi:hypothetical protein
MKLGGTLIVRNAMNYDFCVEATVRSLAPVCDELVVIDGTSDDGTWELLNKVVPDCARGLWTLTQHEWKPSPMGEWLSALTNRAREMLHTDAHLNIQADEVLHEDDYPLIQQLAATGSTYTLERLNFWHDHRHILPPNEKVGSTIVRLAPVSLPCIGDAQGFEHSRGWKRSKARIFHYGFIRDPQKLAAKARPMQQAFFGSVDPVWDDVEKRGKEALIDPSNPTCVPINRLVPYSGTHPAAAHEWLKSHGYDL